MSNLNWMLLWFEAIPGLNINLEKSLILLVGNVEDIEGLARELGCQYGILPTTYLGLPLGVRRNSTSVWDGVEERFRKRLAIWKTFPDKEHPIQSPYIHHVSLPFT